MLIALQWASLEVYFTEEEGEGGYWVPEGTFGYLLVLLGTLWYFWLPEGTFEHLMVLCVVNGVLRYLIVLLSI